MLVGMPLLKYGPDRLVRVSLGVKDSAELEEVLGPGALEGPKDRGREPMDRDKAFETSGLGTAPKIREDIKGCPRAAVVVAL